MATIKNFPNNADEYIGAEYVMKWLHGRTSGVFGADGNLAVSANDDMTVSVSDGVGWIANADADGSVFWNDNEDTYGSKLTLSIGLANSSLPRIDRIVVSWATIDYTAKPTIEVLQGTPASNPTAPALTNTTLKRQISLAQVRVNAGASKITSDNITDERLNSEVCGLVTESVGVDTSVMQAQFNALLRRIETELDNLNAGTETMLKTEYDPDRLGEDLGIQLYTHSKSGTVHNFTGTGMNGRAKITAAFNDGDTVQLNGVSVTATCGADPVDGDTIVNGRWVSFVADAEGGQINFKGGGGLGNSRLKQATAEADMVSEDATFYAGDKTLKTGTLVERGQAQTAGSMGGGGNSDYYAFNDIPEGIYRKNGADWAPEIRYDKTNTINYIVGTNRDDVISSLGIKVRVDISAHLGTHGSTPYANATAKIYIDGTSKGSVSAESQNMNGADATNSTTVTVS